MQPNKSNNDAGGAMNKPAAGGADEFTRKQPVDGPVINAAEWYAANSDGRNGAFIPILKERFGLSALEAIEAAQLAHRYTQEQVANCSPAVLPVNAKAPSPIRVDTQLETGGEHDPRV
ncbi:MAG: hypothetical protein GY807_12225 [Gammaproteobacteria bacterium]|nr:hypothetical protein [Gammaproteobacteria bacterium]